MLYRIVMLSVNTNHPKSLNSIGPTEVGEDVPVGVGPMEFKLISTFGGYIRVVVISERRLQISFSKQVSAYGRHETSMKGAWPRHVTH